MMLCSSDILARNQVSDINAAQTLHDHDLKNLSAFFQNSTRLKALHGFYQELLKARRAITSTSNPNRLLVLEGLFFSWSATIR